MGTTESKSHYVQLNGKLVHHWTGEVVMELLGAPFSVWKDLNADMYHIFTGSMYHLVTESQAHTKVFSLHQDNAFIMCEHNQETKTSLTAALVTSTVLF